MVGWLTMGLSRVDIAARMGLGEETVKTHLATIYRKLGVAGRYEVAARHLSSSPPTPVSSADTDPPPGPPSAPTEPDASSG